MGLHMQPSIPALSLTPDAAVRRVGKRLEKSAKQRNDGPKTHLPQRAFSLWRAFGNFVSGLASPITSMFSSWQNFAIGTVMLVGGISLMIATGGAAAPLLLALGMGMGAYQAYNGAVRLAKAKNAQEAEAAFHDFGAATSIIGLSVLGARASLKPVGVNTTGMSRLGATVQNIKSTPTSLRMSYIAFRSGQWRSNFTQFSNQASATSNVVKIAFRDGSWKSKSINFITNSSKQLRINFNQFRNQLLSKARTLKASFKDNQWILRLRNFIKNLNNKNSPKPNTVNEVIIVAEENNRLRVIADERFPNNGRATATQTDKRPIPIDELIEGLHEVKSEVFLRNMELLLERISLQELYFDQKILNILHRRYSGLGHKAVARFDILDTPIAHFRKLETCTPTRRYNLGEGQCVGDRYHIAHNIPGDTVIEVTHGGGWRFLLDFLSGRNRGYELNSQKTGIMVSPLKVDPDLSNASFFANRKRFMVFDSPATLRFKIKAQHLDVNSQGLFDTEHSIFQEAALLCDDVGMITEITIIKLHSDQAVTANTFSELLAQINKLIY